MATNKNQHFVPRCYLRAFSVNGEGLALNLFNIDRRKIIKSAALKHQCSKDYFYGEDAQLEEAIQCSERSYGMVLREILKSGYSLTDDHKSVLKLFWLLQYRRTEAASKRSVEVFKSVRVGLGEGVPEEFTPNIKEAVLHSMQVFASTMRVLDDLKVCLVKNTSGVKFVTSDDPAIFANRWHQKDRRSLGIGFGLTSAGVLAMLPLTENLLFLAYDGDVYSVPNSNGWIKCNRASDVRAFNQFQYFNCRANIFFRSLESDDEVQRSFVEALPNRPESRHIINHAILDYSDGGYERYKSVDAEVARKHNNSLVHVQQQFAVPPYWPSIIKWRTKGAVYTNGSGAGYLRKNAALEARSNRQFWKEPATRR